MSIRKINKVLVITSIFLMCFFRMNDFTIQATLSVYEDLEFEVKNQPIVDDQVMVKVNVHHPGFIAIYSSSGSTYGNILGYSYTVETMGSHNHTHTDLFDAIQFILNGEEDHTNFIRIPLSKNGRTDTLYARLFNDTNMNMQFDMNGTDEPYTDASGKEVIESFSVIGVYE
jgi:hypothetical protein